jgi:hypothetical protein
MTPGRRRPKGRRRPDCDAEARAATFRGVPALAGLPAVRLPPSIIARLRGARVNDFEGQSGRVGGGVPGGVAAARAR